MAEPRIPARVKRLKCPVCSDVLRNPVTVPCGHNVCMQCLRGRWNNSACSCPECGRTFLCRPQPVRDTVRDDFVRDAQGGEAGSETRKQQRTGASPQARKRPRSCAEPETSGGVLCRRHSSPLEVYCCTDEQIICAVCASAEHTGHRIGWVREERRRKQEELSNVQIKSKKILQEQEKKWRDLEETLERIREEARKTKDYCESALAAVIDSLQRRHLSVRELIGCQEEAAAAQVQISLQTLRVKTEETRKRIAELDRLAQVDSDVHFLQKWPSLQCLWEGDRLHPPRGVSEEPLLPFELTKRAVERLGRRLEEFCDKELASVSHTAAGGEQQESEEEAEEDDTQPTCEDSPAHSHGLDRTLTEQNLEPKTRAQFLQFYLVSLWMDLTCRWKPLDSSGSFCVASACSLVSACEVQLLIFAFSPWSQMHVASAWTPRQLTRAISAGDKEVRLSPLKCKSPAIRYPQRFTQRRQVLCREALQAERCYYEIEVRGGKAEIALAYKGIDRKSRTRRSAFGGNAVSWSLDRSANYSVSHRADSIQLTTAPSHQRIGVYLKFNEGTLSFYEVSDSMNFLYKIEADFKEPLYPGFWLGEKCCIRICDL